MRVIAARRSVATPRQTVFSVKLGRTTTHVVTNVPDLGPAASERSADRCRCAIIETMKRQAKTLEPSTAFRDVPGRPYGGICPVIRHGAAS
jgi:hypothetical protein